MKKKQDRFHKLRFRMIVLIVFCLMSVISLVIIQRVLLNNAQKMGNALSRSYSVEEERNTIACEALLRLCENYIDHQLAESRDPDKWIRSFLKSAQDSMGNHIIDPYVVMDGHIIAANPWEGDRDYDVESALWYKKAIRAQGDIIYTDAYQDAITGKKIITMAKESTETGYVIAFDIFPENFKIETGNTSLPEGTYYYLCDSSGTLLYSKTELNMSREKIQEHIDKIMAMIREGKLSDADAYIHSPGGEKRAVYYNISGNGWISIVSIPYHELLEDMYLIFYGDAVIIGVFLLITVLMNIRERRLNRDIERTNETVRILGNSCYAIYRINVKKETYEMIKGSDYVRKRLPRQGDYALLMGIIVELIEPEAYRDFSESFSAENIRSLVARRVRDYGGDFRRKFGSEYRWVNVRLLFDESLNPGEAVMCFTEVEAEKQKKLQEVKLMKDSLEMARRSEESQKIFFSNMSHDMRTPLNAIISLTKLAKAHIDDPEKMGEYFDKIGISSRQLLGLINDILEISRMEQGKITIDNQQFDLEKCVEECAGVFRTQAEQEKKEFQVFYDIPDRIIYGDAFRIQQILNNLLSNALKFTKKGDKVCLKIKEIHSLKHKKYQIIVSDTGAGMSEAFMEKIFVPFEREVRFGARNVTGTGLGMPIVKNIVSQMGGTITVESKLGEGSAFTVTLPLECADGAEQLSVQKAPEKISLEGKKILVAEDNEINMDIAAEMSEMNGIRVTKAWNGKEAVELFAGSEPGEFDGILMDMQMPVMDGCQAAEKIRSMNRPDAGSVPIVAVTANAFAEDLAATTAAGMNAHVSKPIDFDLLFQTLSELMERKG